MTVVSRPLPLKYSQLPHDGATCHTLADTDATFGGCVISDDLLSVSQSGPDQPVSSDGHASH
jgi:hypothetical protein